MKPPTISLLHATYGRPEKAIETMKQWEAAASRPEQIEYIFAANIDDPTRGTLWNGLPRFGGSFFHQMIVEGNFKGSAPAWDFAAQVSSGQLLIQVQDDVFPPHNFDDLLMDVIMLAGIGRAWETRPFFIGVSDGYRKDDLCCTAIMSRTRMEQEGFFLFPEFLSVYSDDDVTIRALGDAERGTSTFVNARQLIFKHEHYLHNKYVPNDETYARENSSEAYDIGAKLFAERNKDLIARGLRTWS